MSSCIARYLTRLLATVVTVGLLFGLGGCFGQSRQPDAGSVKTATQQIPADSSVAVFTPSDGISISQHTPLNKWTKLVPRLTKAMVAEGFRPKNISHRSDGDLKSQSNAIQDFVVSKLSSATATQARRTTLIVAPIIETDAACRQYGDYFTAPSQDTKAKDGGTDATTSSEFSQSDPANDGKAGDNPHDTSPKSGSDRPSDTSDDMSKGGASKDTDQQSTRRLAKSLRLAQRAGAHVVVLSNPIDGVKPDAFVDLSDAKTIGRMQAMQLTTKLALDKATSNHPKAIEILLPAESDDTGVLSNKQDDSPSESDISHRFSQEAFSAIWEVLGPYFKDGRAISPSGLLTGSSTKDDWKHLVVDASKTSQIRSALDGRLTDSKEEAKHVDGIIAMNDFVSSAVVDELSSLKYTGSSADINPDITVSGIVGSITGRREVNRQAVPAPKGSGADSNGSKAAGEKAGKDSEKNAVDLSWPIVTGYGGYMDMLPHIVDGAQWMTGLENIDKIGQDIAQVVVNLTVGEPIDSFPFISTTTTAAGKVLTIREELIAISASNLKSTLIDPGYISLADAGL